LRTTRQDMQKISGKNKVSVTILGSGTCVPSPDRSACAVLMRAGDNNLVFDAGPGTMRRLLEAGVFVFDVSHLFFSHYHPDHTGELVPFLFANKYPENHRKRNLFLCGGPGFKNFYLQLKSIYHEWIDVSGRLDLVEFGPTPNEAHLFDGFTLFTTPVTHSPESLAYKVTTPEGVSVVYSGDTDESENLIALSRNADLLICESALPDPMKVPGHLTPSSAGRIAARANVKKLVLTHFYPECDTVDMFQQCRKTYSGPLILAKDLLTIEMDPV